MWIHVPSTSSVSVADTEESSLDWTQPWLADLARSATLRTKSVLPRSLQRVWKTVPSIQRLSGLTSEPSIQNRGVEKWLSWLADSPVSHIRRPEPSSTAMTQENSAEKSSESPTGLDYQTSFLRTCPEFSDSTGTPYDPNYGSWVTQLRKDSSRRQKQPHLIRESDSSSWPTPRSTEYKNPDQPISRRANTPPPHLSAMARRWPTPTASDTFTNNLESSQVVEGSMHSVTLPRAAGNWPTPSASSGGTHTGITEETARKELERGNQIGLGAAAAMWPTPTTRDYKGFDSPGKENTHQDPEMYLSIRQPQTTTPDGSGSSPDGPNSPPHTARTDTMCNLKCRRLNPNFAEHLQGLPQGWTDDSAPLETASFQRWRQSLSELLREICDV